MVEAMNCQKNKEPTCAVEIDQRTDKSGSVGPRRVVTTPSTTKSAQAKAVKDTEAREVCGPERVAGGNCAADDIA